MRLQRILTNIVPLVQRVATHVQQRTTRHQLVVHAMQQVLLADIDPQRIEQVVVNLLDNAVKYSPQGGNVTLTLREDSATQAVWVSVQDQGIGIPSHQQAQIFGRFVRAANAQAWGIHGTGLGLHLSRELVEQHGGQLWFESEEDTGTTFFLTLPLVPGQVNDSGALLDGTEHEENDPHPPLSDRGSARKRERSV
jgi:signal transduction histidine kinase